MPEEHWITISLATYEKGQAPVVRRFPISESDLALSVDFGGLNMAMVEVTAESLASQLVSVLAEIKNERAREIPGEEVGK